MRDLLVDLTNGAQLVARCLFWLLSLACLAWLTVHVLVAAWSRWMD